MKATFLDETVMRLPAVRLFYRMVAVNESGRSAPSPVYPLMLCSDDMCSPPMFYYAGRSDRHLLQLCYNFATCTWDTMDLSVKFNAPHVGRSNVSQFQQHSVVYCSVTNHLIELDYLSGNVLDHTDSLRVCTFPLITLSVEVMDTFECMGLVERDHLFMRYVRWFL